MHIAILSPCPYEIIQAFLSAGDTFEIHSTHLSITSPDWIISYRYRSIIKEPTLTRFQGRILNIHDSFLPWNRGADPNFWSWVDSTPKGVTIHTIDSGIDTGPIRIQQRVTFLSTDTLSTAYARLRIAGASLFIESWPWLRYQPHLGTPQPPGGSYHRTSDRLSIWHRFPLGYDTPVSQI